MHENLKNSITPLYVVSLLAVVLLAITATNQTVTESATGTFNKLNNLTGLSAQQTKTQTEETQTINLQKGLQGHWRFDQPKISRGNSLEFDGNNDYVNVSASYYSIDKHNFTLSAWVKADRIESQHHDNVSGVIIGQNYGSQMAFGLDEYGKLMLNMDDTRSGTPVSTDSLEENRWYHVAATHEYPSNLTRYYIDGQKDPNSPYYIDDGNGIPDSSDMFIGKEGRYSMYFDGSIAEPKIYNRSLSDQQIKKTSQEKPVTTNSLLLDLRFDQNKEKCDLTSNSACLRDKSGEGNDGIPQNFNDNMFNTGSGWYNQTPLNRPSIKDYSKNSHLAKFYGGKNGELRPGSVDGLARDRNLLDNPGFEDTSLGTGVNVNASGWDMDHQDLYLNGDSIFDLQSGKAYSGDYGYGEESCCDPYDDGSGNGGTGAGYIAQRKSIGGNKEIQGSIKSNIFVRGLSNVGTCSGTDVYVGEDDSRLRFVAYNSSRDQIGSKWSNWGSWFVYQAGNTSGDYHDWTELRLDWETPADTEKVEMRVYYGDATDSCRSWTFWDGGNGAVYWDDASLTLNQSLKWTSSGKGGSSLEFDGQDDYIQIDESDKFNTNDRTISAWVKSPFDSNLRGIVSRATTGSKRLDISYSSGGFGTWIGNGTEAVSLKPGSYAQSGEWYFVTGVYEFNGSHTEAKLYIDGQIQGTTAIEGNLNNEGNEVRIGYLNQDRFWEGFIREVRFYKRALTASEVESLHQGQDIREGIIGEWNFEAGDQKTAYDTSSLNSEGMLGTSSVSFDGESEHIDVSSNIIDSGRGLSVSTWANIRGLGDSSWNRIVDIQNGTNGKAHGFVWDEDDDQYGFFNPSKNAYTQNDITTGKWQNLVGVIDPEAEEARFYEDGELRSKTNINTTTLKDLKLTVGKRFDANDQTNGTIDEVRVYNRSLSQKEVQSLAFR